MDYNSQKASSAEGLLEVCAEGLDFGFVYGVRLVLRVDEDQFSLQLSYTQQLLQLQESFACISATTARKCTNLFLGNLRIFPYKAADWRGEGTGPDGSPQNDTVIGCCIKLIGHKLWRISHQCTAAAPDKFAEALPQP